MAPGNCLTWPATPSLPLPPRPAGHFTEVPLPTVSAQTGLTLLKIIGEDVARAAAVGTMHHNHRQVGQIHARIERGDFRIVPLGDVAEE